MANTYGFLRSTSDQVGQAVQGVLSVQNNLEEMRKDLASEYGLWQSKKKVLVSDNDRLRSEIARLQAARQDQRSMQEETLRLQSELGFHTAASVKAQQETAGARQRWANQKVALNQEIVQLEGKIDLAQKQRSTQALAATDRSAAIRSQNLKLQQQIFDLNQQVLHLQQEAAKQRLEAGQKRNEMLAEINTVQGQIRNLQEQLVEQAKQRQMVQLARERAAKQVEQTAKQRQELQQARTNCDATVLQLEKQVALAKKSLGAVNLEIQQCQALDAQNQVLQEKLNECNALKRSTR